jgi:hypothetical protein
MIQTVTRNEMENEGKDKDPEIEVSRMRKVWQF